MTIKVSVATTTYNHQHFIAQAVNSVLEQQVAFEYEHVIGEDCSTDQTRDIVVELQKLHPDKIRLLLRKPNIGRRPNFIGTLQACQGEYIALLEGDDYWISPHKLQQQADFLDNHPKCALCFHPVIKSFEEEARQKLFAPSPRREIYTLQDLLERNFIATCSVMFRNGLFGAFPDWFWTVPAGDLPLYVLNAQYGDIGYLDEVMAVHRIHNQGVWSPRHMADRLQDMIAVLEALRKHLGPDYEPRLNRTLAEAHIKTIWALVLKRDYKAIPAYTWDLLTRNRVPKWDLVSAATNQFKHKVGGIIDD